MHTSDSHRPDAVEGFLACRDHIIVLLVGKPELVQNLQLTPRIPNGLKASHCALRVVFRKGLGYLSEIWIMGGRNFVINQARYFAEI